MANIKISSLEETKINNPDASFVMVIAKDDASSLYKNYRISLSELRNIIGSIEGDIVTGVTEEQVKSIVNSAIADIPKVEPGLSELEIQGMIDASISTDNSNELTGSVVQGMIDASITADKLKDTVATVVPSVVPSVIPSAEIQLGTPDDQVVLTVKEVAEKVVVQENTVTEITKEIKEDCVCKDDADDCFNEIFKYIENI